MGTAADSTAGGCGLDVSPNICTNSMVSKKC